MLLDVLIGCGFIVCDVVALFLTILLFILQIYHTEALKPVGIHSFKRQIVLTNFIIIFMESIVVVPMCFMTFKTIQGYQATSFFAYAASTEYLARCCRQTLLDFMFISCIIYYVARAKKLHQMFHSVGIYILMVISYILSSLLTGGLYFVNCRFMFDDDAYQIKNFCFNSETATDYEIFIKWYMIIGLMNQGICVLVGLGLLAKRAAPKVSERSGESVTPSVTRIRLRKSDVELHKQLLFFYLMNLVRLLLNLFIPNLTAIIPSARLTKIVSSSMQFSEFLYCSAFACVSLFYDTEMRHIVTKLIVDVKKITFNDVTSLLPKFIRGRFVGLL